MFSAVALSNNKVFIAYSDFHNSKDYLNALICTINDTEITVVNNIEIEYYSNIYAVSAVALSENKVFIAYINRITSSSPYSLYATVCTINGTEIIKHSDKALHESINSRNAVSAVALSENKVFIAYAYSANQRLRGVACRINEAEITGGMNTTLNSNAYSGASISVVALNENKVFIAHSVNKNTSSSSADYGFLYVMICTIADTEITVESDTQLTSADYSGYAISAVALSENKVFIAYINRITSSNLYSLYATVCTINGTEIIKHSDKALHESINSRNAISAVALSDSQVFITYSYDFTITADDKNHHLYGILCRINNSEITVEENVLLSQNDSTASLGENISTILVDNKIFVSYSKGKYVSEITKSNTNMYALITNYTFEAMLQKVKNKYQKIEGIAKTSGVDGQLVKAVVPNFQESEVN